MSSNLFSARSPTHKLVAGAVVASACCIFSIGCSQTALAAGTTAPGYTSGLPIYAIFPQQLLMVNQTGSTFERVGGEEVRSDAELPFFVYQSDWHVLGGTITLVMTPTLLDSYVERGPYHIGFYNTYGGVQINWKIVDGLFVGYRFSGYVPQGGDLALSYGTIEQRAGFTYLKDGWQATANFMYGTPIHSAADYGIVDWSVTHSFGKWGLGVVGQGELDFNNPVGPRQSEFAVGGLVSYDFGGATLQLKLTRDLIAHNYGGKQTVFWTNLIFPLWKPDAPAAPLVAKY